MKVSLEWLKKYVAIDASVEELEEVLSMIGLEVDSVERTGLPPLDKVVVGEILSSEQHPDADRLSVCEVKVGSGEEDIQQIVCGAKNYKVGDRVPVALVGAVLPGDFKIKKSKLRGVPSHGMMCSPRELGLGDEHAGLMILEGKPEIGTPINEVFGEGDTVFDIELTANRGDCASHTGVARDLAAYYDIELKEPEVPSYEISEKVGGALKSLEVKSEQCPLYTAWSIKGVKVAPSPSWLKEDLERVGLRPVNNIVDITNWVMMESGQPLHAFDLAKLKGGSIIVRQAKEGEAITTLDEKKHVLDETMLVIADEEKPLVIAGVMGSLDAEVDGSTTDIVLEGAYFDPASIRKTARELTISTDSSYRFSRNVDPKGVERAAKRAIKMILEIAGGELVGPGVKVGKEPRGEHTIAIKPEFVRKQCGFEVSDEEISGIYRRLGFSVKGEGSDWSVTVPTYRWEVERPIDLVEEFLRIYGTNKIPNANVRLERASREDDIISVFNHQVGDYLVGEHFDECYHYSLRSGKELEGLYGEGATKSLKLKNPLTAEHTHVRKSLIPGLLDALKLNQHHGNVVDKLFEIGRVLYTDEKENLYELHSVAFVIAEDSGERTWLKREATDFYKAKNILREIAEIAGLGTKDLSFKLKDDDKVWQKGHSAEALNFEKKGYNANTGLLDVRFTKDLDIEGCVYAGEFLILPEKLKTGGKKPRYTSFSSFPPSVKDLALIMDEATTAETAMEDLKRVTKGAIGDSFNLERVSAFDVYQGKGIENGKKSIAFSLVFRAQDRTLKDEEIMTAFDKIQKQIQEGGQYIVRS